MVGLIDFHGLKTAWRVSKPEFAVSVITFLAVLGLGIELGVLIGAGISLAIVLRRAATPNTATLGKVPDNVPKYGGTWRDTSRFENSVTPPEAIILRVDGPIFFANCTTIQNRCVDIVKNWAIIENEVAKGDMNATHPSLPTNWSPSDKDKIDDADENSTKKQEKGEDSSKKRKKRLSKFVLCLSNCDYLDLSGVHMIHMLDDILSSRQIRLALAGPHGAIRDMVKRADKAEKQHSHHMSERTFATIDSAIKGLDAVKLHHASSQQDTSEMQTAKRVDVELGESI